MKKIVAIGRKLASGHTQYFTYADSEPDWSPQPDPDYRPDDDELRKLQIESSDLEDLRSRIVVVHENRVKQINLRFESE